MLRTLKILQKIRKNISVDADVSFRLMPALDEHPVLLLSACFKDFVWNHIYNEEELTTTTNSEASHDAYAREFCRNFSKGLEVHTNQKALAHKRRSHE